MHMYLARKTVLESRATTLILKAEICFAAETSQSMVPMCEWMLRGRPHCSSACNMLRH